MTIAIPSDVSFANGQSTVNYYKSFSNYIQSQVDLNADKIFLRYYTREGSHRTLTYSQVNILATNLACEWASAVKAGDNVALFNDNTVFYLIVMIASMKLRVSMLAISPSTPEASVVSMLKQTKTKFLFANRRHEETANQYVSQTEGVFLAIHDDLDVDNLVHLPINPEHDTILDYSFSDDDIEKSVVVLHSSGSTGSPKIFALSNRYLFNLVSSFHINVDGKPDLKQLDSSDVLLGIAPLFNVLGCFYALTMITVGGSLSFLKSTLPASQEEINYAIKEDGVTVLGAPPSILEQTISSLKEQNDISYLKSLKYVITSGAPLRNESGKWITEQGVNLVNVYGLTETGPFMTSEYDPNIGNWSSLRPFIKDSDVNNWVQFEAIYDSAPHIKHLYVTKGCPAFATDVSNRDDGGLDTGDLFEESVEYPGFYDFFGTRDNILVMEDGTITNFAPLEAAILSHSIVKQVAIIGQNRPQIACLIEIDANYAKRHNPYEIIAAVEEAVKDANAECSSGATIHPQMVNILPFNKTLPSSDKFTTKHKAAESQYNDVIEKMYSDFLNESSNN